MELNEPILCLNFKHVWVPRRVNGKMCMSHLSTKWNRLRRLRSLVWIVWKYLISRLIVMTRQTKEFPTRSIMTRMEKTVVMATPSAMMEECQGFVSCDLSEIKTMIIVNDCWHTSEKWQGTEAVVGPLEGKKQVKNYSIIWTTCHCNIWSTQWMDNELLNTKYVYYGKNSYTAGGIWASQNARGWGCGKTKLEGLWTPFEKRTSPFAIGSKGINKLKIHCAHSMRFEEVVVTS